jgi:hypothetical protein
MEINKEHLNTNNPNINSKKKIFLIKMKSFHFPIKISHQQSFDLFK